MPILSMEPMIYPANLLDEAPPVSDHTPPPQVAAAGESQWFVAHTKPRQEKALARHLFAHGVPYFLPQYARQRIDRDGHTTSWIPLFTGYVFVKADERGRIEALQSNRIAASLRVIEQRRLTDDLRRVKRLIDSQLPLYPEEKLALGRRVRIAYGPLAGMEGIVEGRLGRCRFVVTVDFLRQGVSAEVDARALEPLPSDLPSAGPAPPRLSVAGAGHCVVA